MEKNIEYYLCPRGHRVYNLSWFRAEVSLNGSQNKEKGLTCMVCDRPYSIKRELRIPDSTER